MESSLEESDHRTKYRIMGILINDQRRFSSEEKNELPWKRRAVHRCTGLLQDEPCCYEVVFTRKNIDTYVDYLSRALGGAILYANLPTRLTIGAVVPTVSYLSTTKLIPVKDEVQVDETNAIQASSLFSKGPTMVMAVRRPGCLLCRKEAAELSSLSPIMKEAGIQMVAVVHEVKGVNEFKPYFKGDVYFDKERHFYGPNQRWLPLWMGFLRLGSYVNIYKAMKAGFQGNTDGEGRLLGGVFLIADNKLQYAHLEKEWGDAANVSEIRDFVKSHFA